MNRNADCNRLRLMENKMENTPHAHASMRLAALAPIAVMALALAGCVTARVDYSLAGVRAVPNARFSKMPVTLKIIDRRYADKRSVASFIRSTGAYNEGLDFSPALSDYGAVFGGVAGEGRYYIAPDRLYWTPSGPIADLGTHLGEHLSRAGVFASVAVAEPSTADAGGGRGAVLKLFVKRLVALKGRRPGPDTFGFFGISALFSSREIISCEFEWTLQDASGRELAGGRREIREDTTGSSFRAKNRPFALQNEAARMIGETLVRNLR